ncbi:hypothetical protein E2C01_083336 [Portunus trituberculatus]|uniref:Uncharacterized protein n=1 Tax=Portunus trituberculatus TaxID=210409 RepID=A0A5B7J7J7_PORTR|nr:hypothetical protein [Portunus trituberculatus]
MKNIFSAPSNAGNVTVPLRGSSVWAALGVTSAPEDPPPQCRPPPALAHPSLMPEGMTSATRGKGTAAQMTHASFLLESGV